MRKILVLQHIQTEDLGIIEKFLRNNNLRIFYVRLYKNEKIPLNLDDFVMMISLGGPMDVWMEDKFPWLVDEKKAIRKFVIELEKPFLGICLGCQLLGEIVGGNIVKSRQPEIGFYQTYLTEEGSKDRVFSDFPMNFSVFQWHSYEVDKILNPNVVILASSENTPIQLFKYKDHAYGMQFHIEIDENTIRKWSTETSYFLVLEKRFGKNPIENLESQQKDKISSMHNLCKKIFENFLHYEIL